MEVNRKWIGNTSKGNNNNNNDEHAKVSPHYAKLVIQNKIERKEEGEAAKETERYRVVGKSLKCQFNIYMPFILSMNHFVFSCSLSFNDYIKIWHKQMMNINQTKRWKNPAKILSAFCLISFCFGPLNCQEMSQFVFIRAISMLLLSCCDVWK